MKTYVENRNNIFKINFCLSLIILVVMSYGIVRADSIEERIIAGDDYTEEEAAEISNALKAAKDSGIAFIGKAAKGRGSGAFSAPLEVLNNSDSLALSALTLRIRDEILRITNEKGAVTGLTLEQQKRISELYKLKSKFEGIQVRRSATEKAVQDAKAKTDGEIDDPVEDVEEVEPEVEPVVKPSLIQEGETTGEALCRMRCANKKYSWKNKLLELTLPRLKLSETEKQLKTLKDEWVKLAQLNNETTSEINDREKKRNELSKKITGSGTKSEAKIMKEIVSVTKPIPALRSYFFKIRDKMADNDTNQIVTKKELVSDISSLTSHKTKEQAARVKYENCIKACVTEGNASGEKFEKLERFLPITPHNPDKWLRGIWEIRKDSYGAGLKVEFSRTENGYAGVIIALGADAQKNGYKIGQHIFRGYRPDSLSRAKGECHKDNSSWQDWNIYHEIEGTEKIRVYCPNRTDMYRATDTR